MSKLSFLPALATLLACLALSGCGSHDHDHAAAAGTGHAHQAPNGGILVELGEHEFNLELVLDRTTGELTVYVLDAHAENFVRVPWTGLNLTFTEPSPFTLSIPPVADPISGETIGDTSVFRTQSSNLITTATVRGSTLKLDLGVRSFSATTFVLKPPHAADDDSTHAH